MATAQIKTWDLGPTDVIAQFASIGFDATISEIFTSVLSGACLAVLQDHERLGKELVNALSILKVTVITLPPSLLNVYRPEDFPTLKKVVTAGEPCTLHVAAKWTTTRGVRFFNAYGPTETTVCATIYEYLPDKFFNNVTQDLPIGRAIDGVQVYLFDDFMKPVPPGVIGEMYIGGDGLSIGYVGHAIAKNKERFVQNPLDTTAKLYRTGDHAIQALDGTLTYVGRLDDQVKIRGQRVDLSEIEQIILQHSKVDMAVVVKHQGKRSPDGSIAAFIAPTIVVTSELREYLSKSLPRYMIPTYIRRMCAEDFPLTLNGKVDRKKLQCDESVYTQDASDGNSHLNQTQLVMAKLWCSVLLLDESYAYNMHRLSTLNDYGGNSLHMVLLQRAIEDEFNILLSYSEIGTASTIEDFAEIIKRKKDMRKSPGSKCQANDAKLRKLILEDVTIDLDCLNIENCLSDVSNHAASRKSQNILLSGATGFLGAFLLSEIMEQCHAYVFCMVRESGEVRAFARILSNMRKYDLWKTEYGSRIGIVLSDLSQPQMGIAPHIYAGLCTAIDIVLMNAAQMDFNKDYQAHRQANVMGTKEFIKFAFTGRKKYLFATSSLAIFLFPPDKGQLENMKYHGRTRHESYRMPVENERLRHSTRLSLKEMHIDLINLSLQRKQSKGGYLDILRRGKEKETLFESRGNRSSSFNQFSRIEHNDNNYEDSDGICDTINIREGKEINMGKTSLRQSRSVDISLSASLRVDSPKMRKKIDIGDDISEEGAGQAHKTNKTINGGQRIVFTEDDGVKDPTKVTGGYGQSKWASEQIIFQALEYLPGGAIFRPARVSGQSLTGVAPTNDLFATTLVGMEIFGFIPDMKFPYDLTPVDYCAKGMVEIMLQVFHDETEDMPQVYHFFNKHTISFAELFDGVPVKKLPLNQWRHELRNVDRNNPLLPLSPFLNSDFWDKSPNWPVFSTANTDKYVSQDCKKLMPHSRELLKIYRDFFRMSFEEMQ